MAMGKQKVLPQLQTLISIAALFLMVANMALSQTTHFKIEKFRPNENRVTYEGNAFVPSGKSFLRLTAEEPYKVGRVLYKKPFEFWGKDKQVEFETSINFKITPSTGSTPADGIVFFIAPVGSPIPDGSTGGNLGIFDSSGTGDSVFAVEFDTFKNSWDPPNLDRHIGIDINSHTSSSFEELLDVLEKEVNLTVKYEVAEHTITAKAQVAGSNEYIQITHKLDLSTVLDQIVQVGISASTGQAVSLQDIYSWDFTATMIHRKTVNGAGIRQVVST